MLHTGKELLFVIWIRLSILLYRRYLRMRYWLPKFKNLSPWPLPVEMPDDAQVLAKMAIEQITSVDRLTAVTTHQTAEELPVCEEKTWIVSGISPVQKRLLRNLPKVGAAIKYLCIFFHFLTILIAENNHICGGSV